MIIIPILGWGIFAYRGLKFYKTTPKPSLYKLPIDENIKFKEKLADKELDSQPPESFAQLNPG
jgi:hypothetical protein